MMTRLLIVIGLLLAVILPADPAWSEDGNRIALVIGNAKYPDADAPLKEPVADMRAMADELKRAGFDVVTGDNLKRDAMQRAIDGLYSRVTAGSVALFFFSGYGIQSGRQTFLIPVDGQLWTEADVRREGFSLDTILGELNSRGATVKIAILDASRRNPFERRFRNFSSGLAAATAPQGSIVMYSAAPGTVVADAATDHGLFVNELLKEIRVPGLTAEEALNRTRVGVSRASQGDQVPWFSSSLAEEFSFGPGPVEAGPKPQAAEANLAPPRRPETPDPKITQQQAKPVTTAPAIVAAPTIPDLPKQAAAGNPPASTPAPPSATTAPSLPPSQASAAAAPAQNTAPSVPQLPATQTPAQAAAPAQDPKLAALANDPAIRDLTSLLNDNPNDQAAYYKRGQIYASKGAYAPALSDFDQAIRLNPRDVEALNNRCWVRTIVGELQPALKDCNDALTLRPNFVDALDSRGLANLKLGFIANALNDFDAALKLNPKLASSLYGRGLARQRSGLAAAGDRDIQAAKQISPDIATEFANYGIR